MASELIRVPAAGFTWATADGSRWLVAQIAMGKPAKRYDPMRVRDESLYRTFASLSPTEAEFLSFANRWGPLGIEEAIVGTDPHDPERGESLDGWTRHHDAIAVAVRLWDLIRTNDSYALRSWFHLEPRAGYDIAYRISDGTADDVVVDISGRSKFRPQRIDPENYFEAATADLINRINEGLRGSTSARVDLVDGRLQMSYSPSTLLAALWLQLATAAIGNKTPVVCGFCQRTFEPPTRQDPSSKRARKGRGDRRWCSDKCRYDAANERRRRAKLESAVSSASAALPVSRETVRPEGQETR